VRRFPFAILATVVVACSESTVCTADLRWQFDPHDTTVAVNARFNVRFVLLGCSGTRVLSDSVTWTSSDPAVATVDARTGTVTAIHVGTADITGKASRYPATDIAHITVRN
jgi:Bacterial Ig-like domain (group 2)